MSGEKDGHSKTITDIKVNLNDSMIISADVEGNVRLWNDELQQIKSIKGINYTYTLIVNTAY
jgi:WD40 repeat protein